MSHIHPLVLPALTTVPPNLFLVHTQDVLNNCKRIASMIEGAKRGYPGLDLIIFPEVIAPTQLTCTPPATSPAQHVALRQMRHINTSIDAL